MTSGNKLEKDSILQLLIETVNAQDDYFLDITLNVNGTHVSGTMIPASDYLSELANEFTDDETESSIHEQLVRASESLDSNSHTEANYIHLKEANLFSESGASFPSKGSVLWRGRLSEVDGFFLGKIKES
ncbi:gas vesicle accessory protein GvpU [Alteribacillus iranensis]|uniref:Gas vesicle protein GvpU n=1 Tax=Alteribacillus iranensis TaxID=930128 RepID=A0A1I2EK27_9BACI|nr:gas vesicle accessory protein GvpU [Alteribacillus iranensis]SFE92600.1 hypothetical protein SAMN05192532_10627 [Alteribacillus iranensis]